jgi:excisionase family DNA binding protein
MARLTVPIEVEGVHDVDEAAKLSGRGVATVWRWIRNGKIFVVRIGGRTLVPESEIEKLKNEKATLT